MQTLPPLVPGCPMRDYVLGNQAAADFLDAVTEVAHFWDDLIDGDRALGADEIHARMFDALVTLPRNQFYRDNFSGLNATLAVAAANWQAATRMEREGEAEKLKIAYILRSSYADLVTHAALIVGGPEWARKVAYAVRLETHAEQFDGYLTGLREEAQARAIKED